MSYRPTSFASYGPYLVAAMIAGVVYLLVAVRFGQPLRDAKEAIAEANDVHERLPTYVERAVKKQVGPGINPDEIEKLRGRVAELQVEVDKLRRSAERAESTAAIARREVDDAKRAMAALPAQAANAPGSGVMASPASEFQLGPSTAAAPASASRPPATELPAPPQAVAVSKDGPMQMELIGHRITSRGIILNVLVTRTSGGDSAMHFSGPNTITGVKVVTSDGYELARGSVVPPSSTYGRPDADVGVLENTPIRLSYIFEGKFERPVLCSKIELRARDRSARYAFRFSDVLVSPE